jgi:hypothetical protein
VVAVIRGFVWYYAIGTFGMVGAIVLILSALSLLVGMVGGINLIAWARLIRMTS